MRLDTATARTLYHLEEMNEDLTDLLTMTCAVIGEKSQEVAWLREQLRLSEESKTALQNENNALSWS